MNYVALRLQRLPDSPEKISRGVAAGVFVTFTPFYGLHFFLAAIVCLFIRGNILASLISTFVGNPFTFPIIAAVSYRLGVVMLGLEEMRFGAWQRIKRGLGDMGWAMWQNFKSIFGGEYVGWVEFSRGLYDVFLPYLVGGIIPGVVAGVIAYFLVLPGVQAYQVRRKGILRERLAERLARAAAEAEAKRMAHLEEKKISKTSDDDD